MPTGQAIVDNLLSAPVLAFVVAALATALKVDVRLPNGLYPVLSTYLLLAIGIKGGRGLASAELADVATPLVAALVLGVVTPLVAYVALRRFGRLPVVDAAAVAAHYGSVSAVTFTVVLAFLAATGEPTEDFLAGLLAILEVVGIVVALAVARRGDRSESDGGEEGNWSEALAEVVRGRSIGLLLGGLVIGLAAGDARLKPVDPLFVGLFQGVLTLFLLDMGALAAQRIRDVRDVGWRIVALGIGIPIVNGFLGAAAGALSGLSVGGTAVLATLAASASYIAAPAAVRIALPAARPGLYITASLGITFPFNIVAGIPLYYAMAKGLA